jgi:hypothetical protein
MFRRLMINHWQTVETSPLLSKSKLRQNLLLSFDNGRESPVTRLGDLLELMKSNQEQTERDFLNGSWAKVFKSDAFNSEFNIDIEAKVNKLIGDSNVYTYPKQKGQSQSSLYGKHLETFKVLKNCPEYVRDANYFSAFAGALERSNRTNQNLEPGFLSAFLKSLRIMDASFQIELLDLILSKMKNATSDRTYVMMMLDKARHQPTLEQTLSHELYQGDNPVTRLLGKRKRVEPLAIDSEANKPDENKKDEDKEGSESDEKRPRKE